MLEINCNIFPQVGHAPDYDEAPLNLVASHVAAAEETHWSRAVIPSHAPPHNTHARSDAHHTSTSPLTV